jgi:sugar phosphate isomerase/epimerase
VTHNLLGRVSYHAVFDESILDALRYARAHGFAGVQVAVEAPHLSLDELTDARCSRIASFCKRHGLFVSLHGPDKAASLFAASRPLREGVFGYFAEVFERAERMGAARIVLHVGTMPAFGTAPRPGRALPETDRDCLCRVLEANLRRLVELAAGRFTLCVENVGFSEPVMATLGPLLDGRRLALCWDLPKGRNDAAVQAFYWRNLRHVRQVHLHDVVDGLSHEVLGTGTMDFGSYLPRLAAADVQEYCIEVRPREQALASLIALKGLLKGMK